MKNEKITEEEFLELCKEHLRIIVGCWTEDKKGITIELQFKTSEKFVTIAKTEGYWK